jgi:hypothetical protein
MFNNENENLHNLSVALMNRYDIRPSEAGRLMADIDDMASKYIKTDRAHRELPIDTLGRGVTACHLNGYYTLENVLQSATFFWDVAVAEHAKTSTEDE